MAYNNNGYNNSYKPRNPQNTAPRNATSGRGQSNEPASTGPTLTNTPAGKFINFNYWARCASIEIGAVPMGAALDWNTKKNAQTVRQVISFNDLSDLQDICEEVLDSVKNTGTFTSVGIKVGTRQDAAVEINNGSSLNLAPGIYLVLYKNLDQNGRTNNLEFYPFSNVKIMRGYDHTSGKYKEDISKIGEFKKFYKMVREATKAFTMAQAHSISVNTKNDKLACFKALSAITQSLGIDMISELKYLTEGGGGGRRSYGGGNNGGGGYGAPRSAPRGTFENSNDFRRQQQNLASMDDPVDINLTMEGLTNVDMTSFS